PHRGSAGVPGRRRARGNRSREPADLRRRPDAGRRRRPLPARQRSLLPHGDRGRALPATGPVRRADRPGGRERGIPTGPADGARAGRRARAGAREDHDQDRAGAVSELLSEERLDELEIPNELPVLPLKETVVFPQSMTPLAIGQDRSIKLIEDAVDGERLVALVTVKSPEAEQPGWDDLYEVGTAAVIHKMIRVPDGTLRILVQGVRRIRLDRPLHEDPYLVGQFSEVPDEVEESPEVEALTRNVQTLFGRVIASVPYLPDELELAAANVDDPNALSYLVASTLRIKTDEKQKLLELTEAGARLREISAILNRELEVVELGSKIQSQVQSEMEKGQREYFLRQQLKAIQEELGEGDAEQAELNELRERPGELELPEDVRKAVDRELGRLEKLPSAAAEYGVIRTYLDWIATLPWNKTTQDNLDLVRAREILDEDHYDLEKVKERIVEHLAVS